MPNFSSFLSGLSIGKAIGWAFSAILFLVIVFGSTYVVDQGRYGVVTRFGQIQSVTPPGLHLKLPIIDDVTEMPAALQTVEVPNTAVSRDIQQVQTKVNVQFSIPAPVMKDIFVNYRNDIDLLIKAVVVPATETSTKSVTAKYTAEQLITKRDEVQAELKTSLAKALKANAGIILAKVEITNFDFSPEFTKAIEDNVVAERDVKTAQQQFERKRVLAQEKVSDAKAEAEATRIRADAESYAIRKQNESATDLTVRMLEATAKVEAARNMKNWRPNVIGAQPLVEVSSK